MKDIAHTLSIVIPILNEKNIIKKILEEIEEYLVAKSIVYEIILVDDDSRDGTKQILKEYIKDRQNIKLLSNNYNKGKGAAVRKGILNSKNEYILFMDADLSTPIEEMDKFVELFDKNFDVLIGIRNSHILKTRIERPLIRKKVSRLYNIIVNFLFDLQIYDISCGFKCFTYSSSRTLFEKQRLNGWNFDAEIMLIARRQNLRVKEIPVSFTDRLPSHINIVKDSLYSLINIAKIYFYDLLNKYN